MVVRHLDHPMIWGTDEETALAWWRQNVPIMRHYLQPGDPDFETIFSHNAAPARPRRSRSRSRRAPGTRRSRSRPSTASARRCSATSTFLELRINDDDGRFLGVAAARPHDAAGEPAARGWAAATSASSSAWTASASRARRPAAILFADLEASGALSRRLSSRGYFDLVSGLTDLIDSAVIERAGIVGKHAGDGGSALFLAADFDGSESAAARAAIEAARAIRDGADAARSRRRRRSRSTSACTGARR